MRGRQTLFHQKPAALPAQMQSRIDARTVHFHQASRKHFAFLNLHQARWQEPLECSIVVVTTTLAPPSFEAHLRVLPAYIEQGSVPWSRVPHPTKYAGREALCACL